MQYTKVYATREEMVACNNDLCYPLSFLHHFRQDSKNISIKMLKDVGMTVPKSSETARQGTRAVYMQQNRGLGHATIITHNNKGDVGRGYTCYYL